MKPVQADERQDAAKHENASENDNQGAQAMPPSNIDAISKLLAVSNAVYVISVVFAALATFAIVYLSNKYTRIRELELTKYERDADLKIATANNNAKQAMAVAAAASADAENSRVEQDKLRNERARLDIRLQELEQQQSKLSATNVASQAKIVELEEAAKDRTISEDQQAKIVALLKPFAGQEVEVEVFSSDSEARKFTNKVSETLSKAGLKTTGSLLNVTTFTVEGFAVAIHDARSASPLATAIGYAFNSAGIKMAGVIDPRVAPEQGKFVVVIGSKLPLKKSP